MSISRSHEEIKALGELIEKIDSIMFTKNKALNEEQKQSLQQIKIDYNSNNLEFTHKYFIGRFKIDKALEDKINKANKAILFDESTDLSPAQLKNEVAKSHIAGLLGISLDDKSAVEIKPSSDESYIKVYVTGNTINNYVNENVKQMQNKLIMDPKIYQERLLALLKDNKDDIISIIKKQGYKNPQEIFDKMCKIELTIKDGKQLCSAAVAEQDQINILKTLAAVVDGELFLSRHQLEPPAVKESESQKGSFRLYFSEVAQRNLSDYRSTTEIARDYLPPKRP